MLYDNYYASQTISFRKLKIIGMKTGKCYCRSLFHIFYYIRLYGYFPFEWKRHPPNEKCKLKFSKTWLLYSFLFSAMDVWCRYHYFIVETPKISIEFLNYANKWSPLIINETYMLLILFYIKKVPNLLEKTSKLFDYLCLQNKQCLIKSCWMIIIGHIILCIYFWVLSYLRNFIFEYNDVYIQGSAIQVIIISRGYVLTVAGIMYGGQVILAKNKCTQTVLKRFSIYQGNHPIQEIETESTVIFMTHLLGYIPTVKCGGIAKHGDHIPMAVISLNQEQVLEFLRLDYKSSNNVFKEYMDYMKYFSLLIITVETGITILDGGFVIWTVAFDAFDLPFYERFAVCFDRITVIYAIKLWIMGYTAYCGTMCTLQVRYFNPILFPFNGSHSKA